MNPRQPETIDQLIAASCRKHAERIAFRHKRGGHWQEMSHAVLWRTSEQLAAGLQAKGLMPGDHAALLAPSTPRWMSAYLGILSAGGVAVPVDKELKAAELRHILGDSEARYIFTESGYLDLLLEIVADLPKLEGIILLDEEAGAGEGEGQVALALEELATAWRRLVERQGIPAGEASPVEDLARKAHQLLASRTRKKGKVQSGSDFLAPSRTTRNELVRQGRLITFASLLLAQEPAPSPRRAQDTAVILYTSGTTGRSKGAMLSHANIVSNIEATATHLQIGEQISTLSFLPINHVFEQVCGILLPLSMGGTVSFAESLKKLGENLAEVKPTFFLGVPAVYRLLLDRIRKNIDSRPLSRLLFALPVTRGIVAAKVKKAVGAQTMFVSGGAALDPEVAEGFRKLGLTLVQGYGITETSPVIAAETYGRMRPGTVGIPLVGDEVRIDHPDSEGVGEIVVRGPNVMQGYYKNPRATAEVLAEGWYHTGDLGRFDGEGFLSICGRAKNLIVTPNGKNVYPEEVEHELLKSPFIAEVMVYGHQVAPAAEEVYAIIYPNQEALDAYERDQDKGPMSEKDVEALLRREVLEAGKQLAGYKRVKKFTLREDEFPKTSTRKIKRYVVEPQISATD